MSCANYIPPCLFSLSVSFNTCLPPSLSPVDTVCNFFSSLFFSSHLCPHDFHLFLPFCLSTNFPFSFSFNAADIKKHTSDDNPDKITLEKAIESLKEVMT